MNEDGEDDLCLPLDYNVFEAWTKLCEGKEGGEKGDQESPSKEGWIFYNLVPHDVNWKDRYAVLQGDELTLYKDDKCVTPVQKVILNYVGLLFPPSTNWILFSTRFEHKSFSKDGVFECVASLWSEEGRSGDICWQSSEQGEKWLKALEDACTYKFGKKHLEEKKLAFEKIANFIQSEHALLNLCTYFIVILHYLSFV
eukprot:TRINITY_DN4185_c0_g1_i3.p1 TRINITY_DN4185_c0_g1~~TRINITY_DN4185_c0_g1_i3.p1  ORF type:complete len:198 (-),score=38.66 TRINITY_DN4185_c0_g1_i3:1300-1893(-)